MRIGRLHLGAWRQYERPGEPSLSIILEVCFRGTGYIIGFSFTWGGRDLASWLWLYLGFAVVEAYFDKDRMLLDDGFDAQPSLRQKARELLGGPV